MKFADCVLWTLLGLYLLGCAAEATLPEGATAEPVPPSPTAEATSTPLPLTIEPAVERVAVLITAEEVTAVLAGTLPADCWQLAEPEQSRVGSNITISVQASRPENALCEGEARPFELRVPLGQESLPNGFYGVTVNEQASTSFTYDAQSLTSEGGLLTISGRVWHDVCAYRAGEQVADPPTGCTAAGTGYQGNGQIDPGEAGIGQVVVQLGVGECPADPLLSTVTDQDGFYRFPELGAGRYCVMILSTAGSNELLLAPGVWTAPAEVRGEAAAYLPVEQAAESIDFGWDYALLPLSSAQRACSDKALLVNDVTYPADTRVQAGETLTKTWQVQNVGTCTWSAGYRLVWSEGNVQTEAALGLGRPVVPGAIAEISAEVTIPQRFGRYRGAWWLQNDQGERFGTGINSNNPLILNVVVPAPPPTATPSVNPTTEGEG